MHAIGRVLPALTLLVLFQAGCMKPIHLDISVPQAEQATVDLHLIKGDAAPKPERCGTPCTIEIAPKTTSQVTLRATREFAARGAQRGDGL